MIKIRREEGFAVVARDAFTKIHRVSEMAIVVEGLRSLAEGLRVSQKLPLLRFIAIPVASPVSQISQDLWAGTER